MSIPVQDGTPAGLLGAEYFRRKWSYVRLQFTFVWVYAAAWAFGVWFKRKGPLGKVRKIAAVWYGPPDLPGSDFRFGIWKPLLEADGYVFDNFSLPWMSDLRKLGTATWSWRYSFYRRRLIDRFHQFRQLRHYDVVWLERSLILGPHKSAFMERCLRRMVGKVVLDCTDGGDYIANPEFSLAVLSHVDDVTVGCAAIRDLYEKWHPRVTWINFVFPADPYKIKESHSIEGLPVLGWMGSPGNAVHLLAIESELQRVASQLPYRLIVICREPVQLQIPGAQVEQHQFGADYYDLLARFDIGLFPSFGDNLRVKAKVAMKHQEFMLCGIPQVCSPIGLCEGIVDDDSALIAHKEGEWAEKIVQLLHDEALRRRLAKRARDLFFEMYTPQSEYPKVLQTLTSSGVTPSRPPGASGAETPTRGE
ncbi:MAG: glycosyltransferase family 4 protein [Fimbriimonadaceae bacterium]|nr:glycosyltransferase family 4 protein [Fimbriimonadaceae bacterium]